MNLSTTMMLAILDGHGEPQERQEMRRLMQEAGVDAPLQRWRAVGARLELTLLNGKIIYLPQDTAGASPPASQAPRRDGKTARKPRPGGAHGLHP
jgi:hypothetical protein